MATSLDESSDHFEVQFNQVVEFVVHAVLLIEAVHDAQVGFDQLAGYVHGDFVRDWILWSVSHYLFQHHAVG